MDAQQKDDLLWKLAKRRAGFKWSIAMYMTMNIFLTVLWFITTKGDAFFWPAWSICGWGMGMVYQYLNAYHLDGLPGATEEYKKLKKQNHQ